MRMRVIRSLTIRQSSGAGGCCSTRTARPVTVGPGRALGRRRTLSFRRPPISNGLRELRKANQNLTCIGASPRAVVSSNPTCPLLRTGFRKRISGPSLPMSAPDYRGTRPNEPRAEQASTELVNDVSIGLELGRSAKKAKRKRATSRQPLPMWLSTRRWFAETPRLARPSPWDCGQSAS